MQDITVRQGYSAALILSMIYDEIIERNDDINNRMLLIDDSDLLTLSGQDDVTDEFMIELDDTLYVLGLSLLQLRSVWIIADTDEIYSTQLIPPGLLESVQPGFLSNYISKQVKNTDGSVA